jgi:deazaflavin-dependent oxidoreductase (nitroreductase family)
MFAIVYHRGRRSGRPYSTPINIFQTDDGFVIALTYGPDVDWVKNILRAGDAEVRHRSHQIRVVRPELIPTDVGIAAVPGLVRLILRMINVTEFLHLTVQDRHS